MPRCSDYSSMCQMGQICSIRLSFSFPQPRLSYGNIMQVRKCIKWQSYLPSPLHLPVFYIAKPLHYLLPPHFLLLLWFSLHRLPTISCHWNWIDRFHMEYVILCYGQINQNNRHSVPIIYSCIWIDQKRRETCRKKKHCLLYIWYA